MKYSIRLSIKDGIIRAVRKVCGVRCEREASLVRQFDDAVNTIITLNSGEKRPEVVLSPRQPLWRRPLLAIAKWIKG